MIIRRRRTIGGPKTIDAINSSGACDARNVPSRWCIGRSSCPDRSGAPEKCRLKLRGHNGGESERVNTDAVLGRKGRSEGNEWRGATQLGEDGTSAGTVWFAACRSVDCSPIAPWHRWHQPGTISPIRGVPLRFASNWETAFYDELATDFPRLSRINL